MHSEDTDTRSEDKGTHLRGVDLDSDDVVKLTEDPGIIQDEEDEEDERIREILKRARVSFPRPRLFMSRGIRQPE